MAALGSSTNGDFKRWEEVRSVLGLESGRGKTPTTASHASALEACFDDASGWDSLKGWYQLLFFIAVSVVLDLLIILFQPGTLVTTLL